MSIRSSSGARALISLILPSTALWPSIVLRVGIDSLQDAADHATRAAPPDPTRVGLAPPLAGLGPTRRSRKHASPGQHGANADHQDRAQPMTHCVHAAGDRRIAAAVGVGIGQRPQIPADSADVRA
jgi:hypothetical protein